MSAKTRSWQGPVRDKVTCDTYTHTHIHAHAHIDIHRNFEQMTSMIMSLRLLPWRVTRYVCGGGAGVDN